MARKNYTRPTPGHPLAIPTKEEFESWCESPVTQFVALAYKIASDKQKEAWISESWNEGLNDPKTLLMYKTREDAYKAFLESEFEDYLKLVREKSPLK